MSDQIDVPKVGPVNKKAVVGVAVVVVGFLGWRYYKSSSAVSSAADATSADTGYEDGGTIPAVDGATDWYGSGGGSSTPAGTAPDGTSTQILTNAQWSAYARDQLLAVDAYNGQSISEALGNYLSGTALSSDQQKIVRSAIGVAGYPPVGTHPIIPGGDTTVSTAPSGLRVTAVTPSSVDLTWSGMDGVNTFSVYRSDVSVPVSTSRTATTATVGGLEPNKAYSFQVAALSASGQPGPKSSSVTTRTSSRTLARPATPTMGTVTATTAAARTSTVPGAQGYEWFLNGGPKGHTDAPAYTFSGLKPKTRYSVTVRADVSTQSAGPMSAARAFTTKSK